MYNTPGKVSVFWVDKTTLNPLPRHVKIYSRVNLEYSWRLLSVIQHMIIGEFGCNRLTKHKLWKFAFKIRNICKARL